MQRKGILVVEEDGHVMSSIVAALATFGVDPIITATSPADALRLWPDREAQIKALLTGITFSSGSGVDLAAELRESKPDLELIFSVEGGGVKRQSLEKQVGPKVQILTKPFSTSRLLRAVGEAIG